MLSWESSGATNVEDDFESQGPSPKLTANTSENGIFYPQKKEVSIISSH